MATRDRYDMDMLRAIQKIGKELEALNRNIKASGVPAAKESEPEINAKYSGHIKLMISDSDKERFGELIQWLDENHTRSIKYFNLEPDYGVNLLVGVRQMLVVYESSEINLDESMRSYDTVFTTENVNDVFDYVMKYQGGATN